MLKRKEIDLRVYPAPPCHFSVAHGSVWLHDAPLVAHIQRLPIDELHFASLRVTEEEYKRRFGKALDPFMWLRPQEVRFALGGNIGFVQEPPFTAWTSFVPVASKEGLLFLLRESKPNNPEERGPELIEIHRGVGKLTKDDLGREGWAVTWKKEDSFGAPFREDFLARIVGEDYYFITEAGQVFVARKPDKGKVRKVEEVWGKDKPPITGVLTDNDKNVVYVFGKSKDSKDKAFFFPLSSKPEPCEFDAAVLSSAKTVDEPLRTAVGMCLAVQAAEKKK